MANPFIKHDVYALDDSKVMDLVFRFHELGYGVFWAVVERLTMEPGHRMDLESLSRKVASKLQSADYEAVVRAMEYMVEIGLLVEEDGMVLSERVLRQCGEFDEYIKSQKEKIAKRWDAARKAREEDASLAEVQALVDRYIELCPSLPKVRTMTPNRRVHCRTFLKSFSKESIDEGFRKANASSFLNGRSGNWNGISFDWLINQSNFVKVLEGNYDDRKRSSVCNERSMFDTDRNDNGGFDL